MMTLSYNISRMPYNSFKGGSGAHSFGKIGIYDVVIVARKEPNLRRTIESVKHQKMSPHRIICVISDMKPLEEVQGVEWLIDTIKRGPAFARNMGIEKCDCGLIAGFDGDVEIPDDYMDNAWTKYVTTDNVELLGGSNRTKGNSLDKFCYWILQTLARILDGWGKGSIIGNNYIGTAKYLKKIKFNTDTNMIEDGDISVKFRKEGKTVRFYSNFYVYTTPRRIKQIGGWWKYLIMYSQAWREYEKTGRVKRIKYFGD